MCVRARENGTGWRERATGATGGRGGRRAKNVVRGAGIQVGVWHCSVAGNTDLQLKTYWCRARKIGCGRRGVINQSRAKGVRANDKICKCLIQCIQLSKKAPIVVTFVSKLPPGKLVKVLVSQ